MSMVIGFPTKEGRNFASTSIMVETTVFACSMLRGYPLKKINFFGSPRDRVLVSLSLESSIIDFVDFLANSVRPKRTASAWVRGLLDLAVNANPLRSLCRRTRFVSPPSRDSVSPWLPN